MVSHSQNLVEGYWRTNRKKYSASRMLWLIMLLVVPVTILAAWLTLGFSLALNSQAAVGINKQINYQGRIADTLGNSLDTGNYNFKFEIYDAAENGNLLWTENWTSTTTAGTIRVINGAFSSPLGTSTSLATIDFNSDSLYLQVHFDADSNGSFEEVFTPRKKLTSAPYSFNSDLVDGIHATSTATANQLLALDSNAGITIPQVSSTRALVIGTSTADYLDYNYGDLLVSGDAEFNGSVYLQGAVISSRAPSLAHTFSSWAVDVPNTNSNDAVIYVNPASAAADANLLALDVNGLTKFIVDSEGDVFAKSMTLDGSLNVGSSNISTLIVENNSYLGDAANADYTNINGSAWINTNKNLGVTSSTALVISQSGTGNYLEVYDGASYYDGNRIFTIAKTGVASTTKLFVAGDATTTGNLMVGSGLVNNWGAPSSTLTVIGSGLFTGDLRVSGSATTSGNLVVGASPQLNWGAPTSTLTVVGSGLFTSDLIVSGASRLTILNASTTNIDSLTVYSGATFNAVTTTDTIYAGGYASSTGGLFTQGNGHFGGTLTVDGNITNLATTTAKAFVATDANAISTFAGNVGIGITTPLTNLHILTDSDNEGLIIQRNSATTNTYSAIRFKATTDTSGDTYSKGGIFFERTGSNARGTLHFAVNSVADTSNVALANAKLSITGTGVGIGTTTPAYPLHVAGDLDVFSIERTTLVAQNNEWKFRISGNPGGGEILTDKSLSISPVDADADFAIITDKDNPANVGLVVKANNGNVGIGITTPNALLHVAGTTLLAGNASTTGTLVVNGTAGSTAWTSPTSTLTVVGSGLFTGNATTSGNFTTMGFLGVATSTAGNYYGNNNEKLVVNGGTLLYGNATTTGNLLVASTTASANNTPTLFVDSQKGRVGIGTKSPNMPFQIDVSDNSEYSVMRLNNNAAGTPGTAIEFAESNVVTGKISAKDINAGVDLKFYTYVAGRGGLVQSMMIDRNGYLGVGNITPAYALDVQRGYGGADLFRVGTSTSNNLFNITSVGNVGIGTATPAALLNVNGTTLLGGNASTTGTLVVNATAGSSAWNSPTSTLTVVGSGLFTGNLNVSGNVTSSGTLFVGANPQTLNWGAPTSTLVVTGNATSTIMTGSLIVNKNVLYVNANEGKVGIGTVSPSRALDISGTAKISKGSYGSQLIIGSATGLGGDLDIYSENNATYPISIFKLGATVGLTTDIALGAQQSGGGARVYAGIASVVEDITSGAQSGGLVIKTAYGGSYAERARFSANGYLGIGTPTPSSTLHVLGTTLLGGNASTTGTLVVNGTAGSTAWTSPTSTLTVVGSGLFTGDLITSGASRLSILNASTTNIDTLTVYSGATFNAVTTTDSIYAGGYASTTGGLFTQGNGHYGGALTVDGNITTLATSTAKALVATDANAISTFAGNVGIGTVSPTAALNVYANNANILAKFDNAGAYGPYFDIVSSGTNGKNFRLQSTGPSAGEGVGKFIISNGSGSTWLSINGTTGYTGIGTTGPNALLHVAGTTLLAGNASTTGTLVVNATAGSSAWNGATSTLTVVGSGLFTGNLNVSGNQTTTGTLFVGANPQTLNWGAPTSTLTVVGSGLFTGDLITSGASRLSILNASTTNIDSLTVYSGATFNSVTTTDTLYAGGYASSTGGLFTQGNGHYGGTLTVDGNITTLATSTGKAIVATDANAISTFAGKVGIGTVSPSHKLHIVAPASGAGLYIDSERDGGGGAVDIYGRGLQSVQDISGGYGIWTSRNIAEAGAVPLVNIIDDNAANTQSALYLRQDGTGDLAQFYDATSPALIIKDGGNVGIGITTPNALLHVAGTTLLAGNASTTGTLVVNGTAGSTAWTSPTSTLTVVGSGLFTGNLNVSGNVTSSGTLFVGANPQTLNWGAPTSTLTVVGSGLFTGDLIVSGASRLAVLNASTTNIGTLTVYSGATFNSVTTTDTIYAGGYASTTGGLFTQGNGHFGGTLTVDGNVTLTKNNALYFNGTKANISQDGSNLNIVNTGDNIIYFLTNATYKANISSAGFGVNGTTLSGGGNPAMTNYNETSVRNWNVGGGIAVSGVFSIMNGSGGTPFSITGANNIGISTNTPNAKLHVAGTTLLAGNASTTGTLVVNGTAGSTAWTSPTSTLTVVGSGLFTGNLNVSGNVTSSGTLFVGANPQTLNWGAPTSTLTVVGSSLFTGDMIVSGASRLAVLNASTTNVGTLTVYSGATFNAVTTTDTIYAGGKVNIGTAINPPTYQLQVSKTDAVVTLGTYTYSGGSNRATLYLQSDGPNGINSIVSQKSPTETNARALNFFTGTTEVMRITSAANLVIGTTAANAKLHVAGTTLLAGAASTTGTLVVNGTAGSTAWTSPTSTLTVVGSGLFTGNLNVSGNQTTTGTLFVGANPQTLNWGAPTSTLTVVGSGLFTGDLITSGASRLSILNASTTNIGTLTVYSGTTFNGSATTTGSLVVTGGLATGTALPNATTTANFGGDIYVQGYASTTGGLYTKSNAHIGGTLEVGGGGSGAQINFYTKEGYVTQMGYMSGRGVVVQSDVSAVLLSGYGIIFQANNAGTEYGRFNTNGRFGIGVAAPNSIFHALAPAGATRALSVQTNSSNNGQVTGMMFKVSTDLTDNYYKGGILFERTGNSSIGSIHFMTTDNTDANNVGVTSTRMTITSGGKIGIGTPTPSSTLHVLGTTLLNGAASTTGTLVVNGQNGGYTGWTSPTSTLTVVGSGLFTGNLNVSGNVTSSGTLFVGANPQTLNWGAPTSTLMLTGNATSTIMTGSLIVNKNVLYVNANEGRVGIGTISPSRRLEVSGAETTNPSLLIRNTSYGSGDNTGTVSLQFAFSDHISSKIEAYKTRTDRTGLKFYTEYNFNNNVLGMAIVPVSASTANVGIGTPTPSSTLHVLGTTLLDGNASTTGTLVVNGQASGYTGWTSPTSTLTVVGSGLFTGNLNISGVATTSALVIGSTVPPGGFNPLPAGSLYVGGNATTTGNLQVNGAMAIGTFKPDPNIGLNVNHFSTAVASYGIYASSTNNFGSSFGVNYGGYFLSKNINSGQDTYGLYASGVSEGTTAGNSYGIYATASGSSNANYAGYFDGNVYVAGSVTTTGNLIVSSNTTINNLNVTGAVAVGAGGNTLNIDVGGYFNFNNTKFKISSSGAASTTGTLVVNGQAGYTGWTAPTSTLTVVGSGLFTGDLNVSGVATTSALVIGSTVPPGGYNPLPAGSLYVSGGATTTGNFTASSALYVQDSRVGIGSRPTSTMLFVRGTAGPGMETDAPSVLDVLAGNGGDTDTDGTGLAGDGGNIILKAGDGGDDNSAMGATSGNGGNITIQTGNAGDSTNVQGTGGNIYFRTGTGALPGTVIFGATTTPELDNTYNLGSSALRWKNVFSVNGTIQTSDIHLKNNVLDLSYGLNEVMQLKPITYSWKNDSGTRLGFIAQDVDTIIPEVVYKSDYWGINYEMMIPVLTKAIQEQQKEIEVLQSSSTNNLFSNNTPLVVIDNPDISTQTLVVQQAATFYGTITVVGEANFESKVVFKRDVEIQGKLYVSDDQAGTVVLPAGATSTEVAFKGAYEVVPKITATPQARLGGRDFWISEKSTSTFRLSIEPIADFDISFDWLAMPVKGLPPARAGGAQAGQVAGESASADSTSPPSQGGAGGGLPVPGCRDASATNYNPDANQDDGSCQYAQFAPPAPPVPGCRDASATNYNPNANQDDGSCAYNQPPTEPVANNVTDNITDNSTNAASASAPADSPNGNSAADSGAVVENAVDPNSLVAATEPTPAPN